MGFVQKNKKTDMVTLLSVIFWGLSNVVSGQVVKGLIYFLLEISYIFYMIDAGIHSLGKMLTLGTSSQTMVFDEAQGIYVIGQGDNSMLILLYGVITLVITAVFIGVWVVSVKSGKKRGA